MSTSLPLRTLGVDTTRSAAGPIPFSRLVGIEWTKATDTRAARWLLAIVALSTAGMMLAPIPAPTRFDQTYTGYLDVASIAQVTLVPIVAILMLTGEWSHRSVITTFTQEPRRIRVVSAKVLASLMLSGGAAIFGGVATAAGLALAAASGRTLEGTLSVGDIDAPIAEAELAFKTQAPLGSALTAVQQLQLMKTDGLVVPPDKIQGKLDGEFVIRLPLLPEIEAETVVITGKAKISDVKSTEKIGIINVQSGAVDVVLGANDAAAKGELILNGVLAKVDWRRQSPAGLPAVTSPRC